MGEIFTDIENTKDQHAQPNCDNIEEFTDVKEDDVSHVQDIIACTTITNEEFEQINHMETYVKKVSNQTIADDYNIQRELQSNKNQSDNVEDLSDVKVDDISKIQDVTKCKTTTIEDFEHQKLEFEQNIKKLQSNKSWVKKQVKDKMVSEPYHAKIEIHLKCQQCGYTCLSYDIFTAHQNRYCYYSRYQVISRMGSLNNNESSKQKYLKHNNLDTTVSHIGQQTTKKTLRSLRVSL